MGFLSSCAVRSLRARCCLDQLRVLRDEHTVRARQTFAGRTGKRIAGPARRMVSAGHVMATVFPPDPLARCFSDHVVVSAALGHLHLSPFGIF